MSLIKRFFQPSSPSFFLSTALLLLRLIVGLAFLFHGWGKIQNPMGWMGNTIPGVFQLLAAVGEFGGGVLLIFGLLTRLGALGIGCTMAVAVFFHVTMMKDPFVGAKGGSSYELALVYLAIAFLFLVTGPGKFSLDNYCFGKCCDKSNCAR